MTCICSLSQSDPQSQYRWRWFDTTSPGHYKETETNGTVSSMDYVIVYPSSEVRQLYDNMIGMVLTQDSV